jgi:uncharacterized membrane protein
MPATIENYVPQNIIRKQQRQALFSWGVVFLAALLWTALIISAPIAKAGGFDALADTVYRFFSYLCHQISWRSFHIAENPFAVCARCFGFYGGFFVGLAIYPLARPLSDTEPFARYWLFLAMIPMGVDWSLEFFGYWQNTHLSRLLTGGILGAACAFFIVPALVEIGYFLAERRQNRSSTRL